MREKAYITGRLDGGDGKYALVTETGNKLSASVSGYKLTTTLYTKTDIQLSSVTVDLPKAQSIKRGYYDATKKELVFVLTDDTEIRIGVEDLLVNFATKDEVALKQDKLTAGTNITIDANNVISATGGTEAEYIELEGWDESAGWHAGGTLTTAQAQTLAKSELNYIWMNGMHRLDFRYKDDANHLSTYSASDGAKTHSIEITLPDLSWRYSHAVLQEKLTAGNNIQINNNVISATDTIYDDTQVRSLIAQEATARQNADATLQTNINKKQDKLTAGTNITIDENNVISATGGGASYTAGNGIDITDNTISTKLGNGLKHTDDGKITLRTADSTINVGEFGVRVPYVSTSLDNTANGLAVKLADNTIEAYNSGTGTKGIRVNQNVIQGKLTAGDNITIENNVISATGGTTYTAGTNISITDNAISVSIDDIELTGTSGTFTDEQIQKLSNSALTCLILNNKRFKLQYTSAGRGGIVAMYTSTIDSVSDTIEVDVTNKAWGYGQTLLQSKLTAGDNVSITSGVISAIDTKLATAITLGKQITAQQTVGGIAQGTVYSADTTLAKIIEDLLGGSTPTTTTKLYFGAPTTVPTTLDGFTSEDIDTTTFLANGVTHVYTTTAKHYTCFAFEKSIGSLTKIYQNGLTTFNLINSFNKSEITYNNKTYFLYCGVDKEMSGTDSYQFLFS